MAGTSYPFAALPAPPWLRRPTWIRQFMLNRCLKARVEEAGSIRTWQGYDPGQKDKKNQRMQYPSLSFKRESIFSLLDRNNFGKGKRRKKKGKKIKKMLCRAPIVVPTRCENVVRSCPKTVKNTSYAPAWPLRMR
jgi:hypothetical protein